MHDPIRRLAVLLLVASSVLVPTEALPDDPADTLDKETIARDLVDHFFEGDITADRDRLTAELGAAMTTESVEQVRSAIIEENGELTRVEPAWSEGLLGGFDCYRVPVVFVQGTVDIRISFDAQGRIAGFFQQPHEPTPDERAAAPASTGEANTALEGHWKGAIEIPGQPLKIIVDIDHDDGTWSGGVSIPVQGLQDAPMRDIRVDGDAVTFAISGLPGDPTFDGAIVDDALSGTFSQNGIRIPFSLQRGEAGGLRPQEPKPPFPYRSEDMTCANGDITLAGTLTLPYTPEPVAAVLLVSGSGPQDRDETIFGHKPFLVLADHLTRAGIAVLRMDDRGVGESTGDRTTATTADFAEDALAGVAYLAGRSEIDPTRIGIIGHSEGGIIAPLAATRSEQVAFIVLLAAPGVPGAEITLHQIEIINRADGMPEARIEESLAIQREIFTLVRGSTSNQALQDHLVTMMRSQTGPWTSEEDLAAKAAQDAYQLMSPWYRFFMEHDPRPVLRQVAVPVLALFGGKDLQVDPVQNLPEIAKALDEGGNPDATVWEIDGLNHLFQTTETGRLSEYAEIEETVSPVALDMITDWILARF